MGMQTVGCRYQNLILALSLFVFVEWVKRDLIWKSSPGGDDKPSLTCSNYFKTFLFALQLVGEGEMVCNAVVRL